MATHPTGEEQGQDGITDGPVDGPGRGDPGAGGDLGSSSQDKPEPDAKSSGGGEEERPSHSSQDGPDDSNEKADARVQVVGPEEA